MGLEELKKKKRKKNTYTPKVWENSDVDHLKKFKIYFFNCYLQRVL